MEGCEKRMVSPELLDKVNCGYCDCLKHTYHHIPPHHRPEQGAEVASSLEALRDQVDMLI